ncbi:obscurin [Dryobates pubescens]|uniref:obscurin n=1 Tax=Dryobates pubescens TaxID=118200 RepID=UPI0023B9DF0A|nr:obscurin [Dryobates pubescens]
MWRHGKQKSEKAQRQIPDEEPRVPTASPRLSREERAAGDDSTQERTVPITSTSPAPGAGDWYRREGDVVWDVHSEVYIETTERTRVYKTEEKTPASPPYMQVTIEDVQVNCGERAKFQAVIEGTPQPTVLWFKGTSLLTDSNRVHQGKEGTTYFLVVDNAVSEDGGVYTCVAKNAGGEVLCKAELVVREETGPVLWIVFPTSGSCIMSPLKQLISLIPSSSSSLWLGASGSAL